MKTLLPYLAGAALLLTPFSTVRAEDDLHTIYQEGRAAFFAGQFEIAREKLSIVLQKNPNHPETRAMMAQITQKLGEDNTILRKSYEKVILPKYEVSDVTLDEALAALRIMAKNASKGTVMPNIILKSPEIGKKQVTLSLTSVPLSEVLNYLSQMTGARLSYEKSGVMFSNPAG
jgi:hypothetical protein